MLSIKNYLINLKNTGILFIYDVKFSKEHDKSYCTTNLAYFEANHNYVSKSNVLFNIRRF
jgi:hypothetical protein